MRLENPHSLSYHASTRTKRLSSTCVCVTSKVELCGSWLKSTETVGALLMPRMPRSRFDFAASSISELISSPEVSRAASNVRSISDTLAVGTRIAVPSSLPFKAGNTSPIARAAQVAMQRVLQALVAGIGVDRRHEAALDADALVEYIGDGREAVGRARAVRDDLVFGLERLLVDTHDDGHICPIRWG